MMEVEMSDRLDSGEDFAVKGGDEAASGNETKEANTAEGGTVAVPEDALPMAQGMGGGAALWLVAELSALPCNGSELA